MTTVISIYFAIYLFVRLFITIGMARYFKLEGMASRQMQRIDGLSVANSFSVFLIPFFGEGIVLYFIIAWVIEEYKVRK